MLHVGWKKPSTRSMNSQRGRARQGQAFPPPFPSVPDTLLLKARCNPDNAADRSKSPVFRPLMPCIQSGELRELTNKRVISVVESSKV